MKTEELYKIAIETRNLEISLFWQRSNYFMVLNTTIVIVFFSLTNQEYVTLLPLISIVIAVFWFYTTLGSKFWQSRWEEKVSVLEKKLSDEAGGDPINMFSADWNTINSEAKASLKNNHEHNWLRKLLDSLVMLKPSVSYQMTLLSLLFIIFWAAVILINIFSGSVDVPTAEISECLNKQKP